MRALLLALSLAGCTTPSNNFENLRIDPTFTPEEVEQITAAADAWCDAGVRCWEVVISPYPNIVRMPGPCDAAGRLGKQIKVYPECVDCIESTVTHELGHHLGAAGHIAEPGHVMSERSHCSQITERDIEWVTK